MNTDFPAFLWTKQPIPDLDGASDLSGIETSKEHAFPKGKCAYAPPA